MSVLKLNAETSFVIEVIEKSVAIVMKQTKTYITNNNQTFTLHLYIFFLTLIFSHLHLMLQRHALRFKVNNFCLKRLFFLKFEMTWQKIVQLIAV